MGSASRGAKRLYGASSEIIRARRVPSTFPFPDEGMLDAYPSAGQIAAVACPAAKPLLSQGRSCNRLARYPDAMDTGVDGRLQRFVGSVFQGSKSGKTCPGRRFVLMSGLSDGSRVSICGHG